MLDDILFGQKIPVVILRLICFSILVRTFQDKLYVYYLTIWEIIIQAYDIRHEITSAKYPTKFYVKIYLTTKIKTNILEKNLILNLSKPFIPYYSHVI